jgi:ribonucleoside-diphosphate reductase alpha chain
MPTSAFTAPVAEYVWHSRYRFISTDGAEQGDRHLTDTWERVARTAASVEPEQQAHWQNSFYDLLQGFKFLPGGRILAGAGTGRRVTLANCFVMGAIGDAMDAIFDALREGALTMQSGGGVGYDFSTLRPRGADAVGTGNIASGPVAFMHLWDAMCAAVCATGSRRGAMMAVLHCAHPDVREFMQAKSRPDELTHFNCSLGITDAFIRAVDTGAEWDLTFPAATPPHRVFRREPAADLWHTLMACAYHHSEPGVLFLDRINRANNLWYCEQIKATNPCGEAPLPPYGACILGSFNLAAFVRKPFTEAASFALDELQNAVPLATRLLDNMVDVSYYPLAAQAQQAKSTRRLGLGVTGLADALIMLGLPYDSEQARALAAQVMRTIQQIAYQTSTQLGLDKGVFELFDAQRLLAAPGPAALPADVQADIKRHGLRNSHLTAVAPAGTISLLANNVSSGIEPVFAAYAQRNIRNRMGELQAFDVEDHAHATWRRQASSSTPPPAFVTATELTPEAHLAMQAAVQPHVDQAVAKTINLPEDYPYDSFEKIFRRAYELGLKGCTTYRPTAKRESVLSRQT